MSTYLPTRSWASFKVRVLVLVPAPVYPALLVLVPTPGHGINFMGPK